MDQTIQQMAKALGERCAKEQYPISLAMAASRVVFDEIDVVLCRVSIVKGADQWEVEWKDANGRSYKTPKHEENR